MAQHIKNDLSIVISGQAGQGIQSIEYLLTHILKLQGYHVFAVKEYMSRVRGGTNSTEVRISSEDRRAFVDRIDLFLPLDKSSIPHCADRLSKETIIIGEKKRLETGLPLLDVPLMEIAHDVGNRVFANTVAAGVVLGMMQSDHSVAVEYIRSFFARKGEEIVTKNIDALERGFKIGEHLAFSQEITFEITKDEAVKDDIFLTGVEAVGFGALAGGCNFCSSYPMSPSTGLLTFLAQHGKECGVLAEQATDEIGAINMNLGAWYAGARGIITTSGGGFALMTEAISLAGITEMPCVLHLAQRPGPATGLPTRTGQEDLNLVRYAGHGEFPRAIFAPGSLMQAYEIAAHAMDLADTYQVPVMILTDQYFVDLLSTIEPTDLTEPQQHDHIIETKSDYQRYALTDNGISPRGVPGYGKGLVCVDSDEHDESGHITEDYDMRDAMTQKRLYKKAKALAEVSLAPEVTGPKDYTQLVVVWGSNYHVAKEALERSGKKKLAVVHFSQLYPLHKSVKKILAQGKKLIVCENNETGQFANLLEAEIKCKITGRINRSNGKPFSVEFLTSQFKKI